MAKKTKKRYNMDNKERVKSAVEDRKNIMLGSQMFLGNMLLNNTGLQSYHNYRVEFGKDIEDTTNLAKAKSEIEELSEKSSKTINPS